MPSQRSLRYPTRRKSCYVTLLCYLGRNHKTFDLHCYSQFGRSWENKFAEFHSGRSNVGIFVLISFACGNVPILMKLALGKIPLSQNRRGRALSGHYESRRSFPFVLGLGFIADCAPAPVSTLAWSWWLFCRGIFLWELLLHCTAN